MLATLVFTLGVENAAKVMPELDKKEQEFQPIAKGEKDWVLLAIWVLTLGAKNSARRVSNKELKELLTCCQGERSVGGARNRRCCRLDLMLPMPFNNNSAI